MSHNNFDDNLAGEWATRIEELARTLERLEAIEYQLPSVIPPGLVDHGGLIGLGDDDHAQYVHISTARTISAQHTFAPGIVQAPFVLAANAQGQLIAGLNADLLDGLDSTALALVGHTHAYVPTSRVLTAGAGLTGLGDLSADRTVNVGAGDGITVNADDVAVNSSVARSTWNLSQFAATTSAQLAAIISDEVGSGALVFGTSPTLGGTIAGAPTASGSWTFTGGLVANSAITGNNTINLTGTGASSVAGNFSSSASNGGATQSLTVQNTSNTASSNARALITVGGTSAGDPYAYFEIPSGSSWAIGADNSDLDSFVVSASATLGTENALKIDTSKSVFLYGYLLDFESTTSGGTNQFKLANNSNTANSKAEIFIVTAGASAHDPYIHYNVSSVTDWAMGIDNSDSDAFLISVSSGLGANNALRIDTSKNVYLYGTFIDFQSTSSGSAQHVYISNNSNTASSQAKLTLAVAGSSASDTFIHALVAGATDWTWGIDNSDSDAWVLAQSSILGINNAIRVGTDLIVTIPNILSATTGTSGYIPWSNYLAPFPVSVSNYTYSFTIQRTITLRNYRINFVVNTTNDGSNYWNIRLRNLAETNLYLLGTTSAATAGVWASNTGDINASVTTTDSSIFIFCEKVGSPGTLVVASPAIYFY